MVVGDKTCLTLKMEATDSFETLVPIYAPKHSIKPQKKLIFVCSHNIPKKKKKKVLKFDAMQFRS